MNTLVLLGNGKSISDVDFGSLSKCDTIGMNASYKLWSELDWFPTYFYVGRRYDDLWGDEIKDFVRNNAHRMPSIFLKIREYPELLGIENVKGMTFTPHTLISPDPNMWSDSFELDFKQAAYKLETKFGENFADIQLSELPDDINPNLNSRGLYKVMMKQFDDLKLDDFIPEHLPRYIPEFSWPMSFTDFRYEDGFSGIVCAMIGKLLGYRKILLLGCDSHFVINPDGTVNTEQTYGIKNVFNGKVYDLKREISCDSCRTTEGMSTSQMLSWFNFRDRIEFNHIDLEIVNCTPNSALKMFRESTLEEELKNL